MSKNLLIITQTVDKNDSNLGFFCGWITEFSKHLDNVYVIANKVGEYDLPKNVTVLSLGKESGAGRFTKIIKFWAYLLKYLPKSNGLLAHMCPEYIVYGGWIARLFGKKIGLWYLHKSVTWQLRLAAMLSNYIFTAHKDGVMLKSDKITVTGHGIDVSMFKNSVKKSTDEMLTLLTVGRLSSSKNLLILVKSAIIIRKKYNKNVRFIVVGEPYLVEDKKYLEDVKRYMHEQEADDVVQFVGKVPHPDIHKYHDQADVFLNAGRTGGVDKAVLEAMASSLPVITSNIAFKNILPESSVFSENNIDELVNKIMHYKDIDGDYLRTVVEKNHSLQRTVEKIINDILGGN